MSASDIRYDDASARLVEHLPELREANEAELRWWGDETPGPHIIYGNILNPYIVRCLETKDEAALRRVFALLELMSTSDDILVQEVVAVTVCEYLGGEKERLRQAERFMGPATLKISGEVERFWNGGGSVAGT